MNAVPLPLLPVGKDCDCGHPLVWYGLEQRCAVYGQHTATAPVGERVHFRSGPWSSSADRLIYDLATLPCPAPISVRERRRRATRAGSVSAA